MNVERISHVAHFLAEPKRLQLLAALEGRPATPEALEEGLDLEPARLHRLLQQLAWFGFIERTPAGTGWRLASTEVTALVRALLGLGTVECSRADVVVPLFRGGTAGGRRPGANVRGGARRHGDRP
ncbi:MAG: hypothetical protein U1E14_19160 [Geminicoccaceae bacterium]